MFPETRAGYDLESCFHVPQLSTVAGNGNTPKYQDGRILLSHQDGVLSLEVQRASVVRASLPVCTP